MPQPPSPVTVCCKSEASHSVYERASKALASLRQSDPELQRLLRAEVARTLFGEDSNIVACMSPPIPRKTPGYATCPLIKN